MDSTDQQSCQIAKKIIHIWHDFGQFGILAWFGTIRATTQRKTLQKPSLPNYGGGGCVFEEKKIKKNKKNLKKLKKTILGKRKKTKKKEANQPSSLS